MFEKLISTLGLLLFNNKIPWLLEFDSTIEGANFILAFKQVLDNIKE